jgi:hypothetical protein
MINIRIIPKAPHPARRKAYNAWCADRLKEMTAQLKKEQRK